MFTYQLPVSSMEPLPPNFQTFLVFSRSRCPVLAFLLASPSPGQPSLGCELRFLSPLIILILNVPILVRMYWAECPVPVLFCQENMRVSLVVWHLVLLPIAKAQSPSPASVHFHRWHVLCAGCFIFLENSWTQKFYSPVSNSSINTPFLVGFNLKQFWLLDT